MKDQSPSPCFSLHVQPRTAIAAARFLKEDPPQLDDGMLGVRTAPGGPDVAQVHTDTSPLTDPWHDRTFCQEVWCFMDEDFFDTANAVAYQIRDHGDPSQGPKVADIEDYYDGLPNGPTHYALFDFIYASGEPNWSTDTAVKDLTGVAFRVYDVYPYTSADPVAWMFRNWDATNDKVTEFWVLGPSYEPPKYNETPDRIYVVPFPTSPTPPADVEAFMDVVDTELSSSWTGVYTTKLSAVVTAF